MPVFVDVVSLLLFISKSEFRDKEALINYYLRSFHEERTTEKLRSEKVFGGSLLPPPPLPLFLLCMHVIRRTIPLAVEESQT